MTLWKIEKIILRVIIEQGSITGTSTVGFAIWPNRNIQPQGAAAGAGRFLRRLIDRGFVITTQDHTALPCYRVTSIGHQVWKDETIDSRQMSLLEY